MKTDALMKDVTGPQSLQWSRGLWWDIYMLGFQAQSLGTVLCGHALLILFTLLPIFMDKSPNSKGTVLVPKYYIEIDLNFLK